jgi:hypothetical protein
MAMIFDSSSSYRNQAKGDLHQTRLGDILENSNEISDVPLAPPSSLGSQNRSRSVLLASR